MLRFQHHIRILLSVLLMSVLVSCSAQTDQPTVNDGEENNEQQSGNTMDSLSIGDRIVDPSWTWEFRRGYGYTPYYEDEQTAPVVWIVVAKNHYMSQSITLIAENLIGYYYYDATMMSGMLAGRNHWGNSGLNASTGLRPWLNSTDQHSTDGFYTSFSNNFKSIILTTDVDNVDAETGTHYSTSDHVFIPSHTEMGGTDTTDTFEIGSCYEYFKDADYIKLRAKILGDSWEEDYWTRSPYSTGYRVAGMITDSGIYVNNFADFNNVGVRPVVNVNSSTKISSSPNAEGVYEIVY